MKTKLNSNRGITFIELMIIVVIIGIVAALAVPRFQTAVERMRIQSANRDLNSSLRLARSYAISNKDIYGVHFDNTNKTVILFKDKVNVLVPGFEVGDSIVRADTLPQEIGYIGTDCTNDCIVFRPNGSAVFVGGGNINTVASTNNVVAIGQSNVLASTGRIQSVYSVY